MNRSIFLGNNPDRVRSVYPPALRERLKIEAGLEDETVLAPENIAEHADLAAGARYAFSTWGMPAFSEDEIRLYFPSLEAVFYAAGSVQGFARPFLKSGIRVFSAWGANGVPVAEFSVSQILLANKGFFQCLLPASRGEKSGTRAAVEGLPGNFDCFVGVIGAGMIGSMVIRMLKQYRLNVLVFDPFLPDEAAAELGAEKCGLLELFERSQTISNHLADNPETRGMLDYGLFSRMRENAVFINTGRGRQVVEDDLVRALREQPRRAAVLDVTYPEPPQAGHAFYEMENVFLTPHIAGSMGNEIVRMGEYMAEESARVSAGLPALYEVTEARLATMA